MENLLKEVRRVQRRLAVQSFLTALGWCWFWSLLPAALVIAAARLYPLGIVDWQWLAGLLAAGLAGAIGRTLYTVTPPVEAALEIDHRFGLKERLSSALAMHPAERDSEAGRALLADALARLRRIEVLEQFPIRPSRQLLLPLLAALPLMAAMIFPPAVKEAVAAAETPPPAATVVKHSANDLLKKMVERRQQAVKQDLTDTTNLLKRMESETKEIQKEPQREKALVKLNDLARELQERRKQLGGSEALKRQMEKVPGPPFGNGKQHGLAGELAKSLATGDFQKASQALKTLQEKLANGKLDSAQKEDLAKRIEQLKQRFDQLARQAKNNEAELRNRADQLKPSDKSDAAKDVAARLKDEIGKLEQQGPQLDALQKLAERLEQSCQQAQAGQSGQAAKDMQEALRQIEDLARPQSELAMLDGALEDLSDARRQLNCEACGGKGCEKCQGAAAESLPMLGRGGGSGIGKERGAAVPPEPNINASFFDSRVPQTVGNGPLRVTGLTGGPNLKNQAEAEIRNEAATVEHGSTDPLSGRRLPRKQSEHVREYFDSFRNGK
jgi:hypothetical protein